MLTDTVYTAVDVGTSKVCTLVAHLRGGVLELIGAGISPSKGLRKGVVVNIQEASEAVAASLDEAARSAGVTSPWAYVPITGSHLELYTRWGSLRSLHYNTPLSYSDIDRAIEMAYPADLPPEKQVLHLIPQSYSVDGLTGVRNPIGMHAARLDVETLCVAAAATPIQHLVHTVERAKIRVQGVVMAGLACGDAVLAPEEKEAGVVLLEIGGGTTGVSVYQHGAMRHAAILPVGGYQLTTDLAVALNAPFDVAEEAKLRYGDVLHEKIGEERVEIRAFGDRRTVKVERRELCRYLHERADELLRLSALKVREFGYPNMLPAGVVLAGGSANLPGLPTLARHIYGTPVRIGAASGVAGLSEGLQGPAYATAVGALMWSVQRQAQREQMQAVGKRNGADDQRGPLGWVREQVRRVAL
jgi:cell division protein FtsA